MGGGLPARHRHWVLHDVTTKRWRWRALFRSVIQVLPVAVLLYAFLPTLPWVRLMAIGGGLLVGMIYAVAYLEESTEHRALKAGFTRGTAGRIRGDVDIEEQEADERYLQRDRDDGPATPDSPG
jgi:Family of unknown function (DUF5313)